MNGSKRIERLLKKAKTKQKEAQERAQIAVGYVRVSSDRQVKRGHGLASQERAIRAFSESQGYDLLAIVRDAGVSGATQPATREGFRQVLELAEAKAFSILLVWKIDRLARSIVHAVTTVNELMETYGVVLRSVTEPIDTASPLGQTIFSVLAGMAEQERQAIVQRTLSGKRFKAEKGQFTGAMAPFGYRTDGQGHLVVHRAEARVVKRIFKMRDQGKTLQEIADWLNDEGVETRRGGQWHPATARYILQNPRYTGYTDHFFPALGDDERIFREGEHEAIVEE